MAGDFQIDRPYAVITLPSSTSGPLHLSRLHHHIYARPIALARQCRHGAVSRSDRRPAIIGSGGSIAIWHQRTLGYFLLLALLGPRAISASAPLLGAKRTSRICEYTA
jgi:hypothetical protein